MYHILVCKTEDGPICFNVNGEADYTRIMSQAGSRELSPSEIKQYGMEGYESLVCPVNTVVNRDGTVTFMKQKALPSLDITDQYTAAVQKALNSFAQQKGYDNIVSACSYVTSTNPQFAAEAAHCVKLRDETWIQAHALIGKIKGGALPATSTKEFLAMLPVSTASWDNA